MEDKKVEAATGAATEQQQPSSSSSTQFSSNNVQQTLLLHEENADAITITSASDVAAAKRAGDAIERYVVARTARRRIRRFLRERDTVWDEVTNNANTRSSSSTTSSSSSSRQELESLASAAAALSPAAMLLLSYGGDEEEESTTGDFQDVVTVMKEYGLTFNDICIVLTHSPNLALRVPRKIAETAVQVAREKNTNQAANNSVQQQYAESLEETLDRSFKGLLQSTLKLRRYDARKVLRGCPNLLSVRGSKSACQIIVIMNKTGVSYSSLARDKNGLPTLLSRSPAGLFKLISFLSTTAVRMPIHQIGPLIRKPTSLLMDAVNPIPLSLQTEEQSVSNDEDDDDEEAVWSTSRKARDVTAERKKEIESTYSDMTRTALILQKQIGSKDLSRVVAAYPQVLLLDAEKQILPVARYLMGGLGIWEDDLSSLLQLYPTLLGRRIDDLEKVVSYLVDELGVNEDDLGTIFRSFPVLFSLSIENDMKPVVEYLKEHCGIGDNKDMLGSFITRLPPVLGYNVTTEIQPKWEYLKKITLRPEWELNAFPAYFSYPFNRVIQTRFNYLSYKGMFWFATSNRIDTVLRFGDIDFATKIALDDDNGKAYKEFGQTQRTSSGNNKAGTAAIKHKPWVTTKKKNNNKSSLASRSGGRGRTPDDVIRNLNADIRKSNSKKYRRRRKAAEAATAKAAAIASDEEVKKASSLSKKKATSTKTKTKNSPKKGRQGEADDGFGASMAFPSPA
ncbi:hypothetical protein FRACYDRAFT_198897 [Fragilariopsis cylindrus CCMP1102]|uniref:mTERF-domain-containing protein n=1 Tax=Fragilariopsis cylindrus CCMP1102 TaxID=635003 RepID=A0A1E7EM31_9STRA|nr:hypothetical protein FRACYDRAFT_198897 [Fragilariopsis cylindrus CCMP1102]|eukprot:OEU06989.1 hypothetical protein FRACYDRAFT_198897 [Fragilariopsis cylindrus CCMP1102]